MALRFRFVTMLAAVLAAVSACPARADSGAVPGGGDAYAWGYNHRGQLGDGTTTDRPAPVALAGLPPGVGVTCVDAGNWHSLAAGSDGRAYAWGYNYFGQLGDGTTADRSAPVQVAGFPEGAFVVAVSAGVAHSLALDSDGRVYAWGDNQHGQLGDGGGSTRRSPVRVAGLPTGDAVTAIAAGDHHGLALTVSGGVYAWGWNEQGQLGDGSYIGRRSAVKVPVLAGVRITAIAAGGRHSLAVEAGGKVYAWGYNLSGQIGDGSYATRPAPVAVAGLPAGAAMTSVAAGLYHSLALGSDGCAYAWGSNDSGELGDGTSGYFAYRSHPAPVLGFPAGVSVASISAGAYHSLAVDTDGRAYAWGYNYNGQLGDGGSANRATPVRVDGLPDGASIRHMAGGGFHTLAVTASPPPSLPDARRALLLSGGLAVTEPGDMDGLDAPPDGAVTIVDAVSALRRARQPQAAAPR